MQFKKIISIIFLLLIISVSFSQRLTETALLQKEVFNTKSKAIANANQVYRLALVDFDPNKDGFIMGKFTNCQALDMSVSQNVTLVPLGIKKMINLEYLNLSNTQIEFAFSYLKKIKSLKVICVANSKIGKSEIAKFKKLGIKVIENESEIPSIFKYSNGNINQEVTNTNSSSNVVNPTTNKTETKVTSTTTTTSQTTSVSNTTNQTTTSKTVANTNSNSNVSTSQNNNNNVNQSNTPQKDYNKVLSLHEVNEENAHLVKKLTIFRDLNDFKKIAPKLTNLEYLRISYLLLYGETSIPQEINHLKKLSVLEIIHDKKLTCPDITLTSLDTLKLPEVDNYGTWLKNNPIKYLEITVSKPEIPKAVTEVNTIKDLTIILNYLYITSGSSLKGLSLTGIEKLKDLENLIVKCENPEKRSVSVSNFIIGNELSACTKLKSIEYDGCTVSEIPAFLGDFKYLESIAIRANSISPELKKLTQLKKLRLFSTFGEGYNNPQTKNATEVLPYLTNLEILSIAPENNTLNLSKNPKINDLMVDFSKSTSQPQFIFNPDINLIKFGFTLNKSFGLKENINLSQHTNLERINFFYNKSYKQFPLGIQNCKKLEYIRILDLNVNGAFPEEICAIGTNLKYLQISNAGFKNLPDCLPILTKLETIITSGTFNSYPEGLLNMKKLKGADLKKSNISEEDLKKLKSSLKK